MRYQNAVLVHQFVLNNVVKYPGTDQGVTVVTAPSQAQAAMSTLGASMFS